MVISLIVVSFECWKRWTAALFAESRIPDTLGVAVQPAVPE
jgi:hypothetical protein